MSIEFTTGAKLSSKDLLVINKIRNEVFGSNYYLDPVSSKTEAEAIFVLMKDDDEHILAFGKLHKIGVVFHGHTYSTLCISTLVAIEKGKGYGKAIMSAIKDYLKTQAVTALGFCETRLLPFYQKCGVEILASADNHFFYLEKNGETITNPDIVPGEVIFIHGQDGFMDKVLASRDKKVGVID